MKYRRANRRVLPPGFDGLKERTRRNYLPEDYAKDYMDEGYDVFNQDNDNPSPPNYDRMEQE